MVNVPPVDHVEVAVCDTESEMETLDVASTELLLSNFCVFKITGSDVIPKISAELSDTHNCASFHLFKYVVQTPLGRSRAVQILIAWNSSVPPVEGYLQFTGTQFESFPLLIGDNMLDLDQWTKVANLNLAL